MDSCFKKIVLALVCVWGIKEAQSATTAFPEICRVMKKYRTCTDSTFRVACPNACDPSDGQGCDGLPYFSSYGMCYLTTQTHTSDWPYAIEFCQAYSGKLAVFRDSSYVDVVTALVTASESTKSEFHVGCLNQGTEEVWVCTDESELTSSETNWDSGYPSVTSDKPNCMWVRQGSTYQQRNDNCDSNFAYICERDPFASSNSTA